MTILADLNVPTCALRLLISYLTDRKMCVRFNGATSDDQDIPGGGPQGGLLTVLLYNLQVNLAGAPCPLQPLLLHGVQGPDPGPLQAGPLQAGPLPIQAGPLPPCHQQEKTLKKNLLKLV